MKEQEHMTRLRDWIDALGARCLAVVLCACSNTPAGSSSAGTGEAGAPPEAPACATAGGESSGDASACEPPPSSDQGATCDSCLDAKCGVSWCACEGNAGCISILHCMEQCLAGDPDGGLGPDAGCSSLCEDESAPPPGVSEIEAFLGCSQTYCAGCCTGWN